MFFPQPAEYMLYFDVYFGTECLLNSIAGVVLFSGMQKVILGQHCPTQPTHRKLHPHGNWACFRSKRSRCITLLGSQDIAVCTIAGLLGKKKNVCLKHSTSRSLCFLPSRARRHCISLSSLHNIGYFSLELKPRTSELSKWRHTRTLLETLWEPIKLPITYDVSRAPCKSTNAKRETVSFTRFRQLLAWWRHQPSRCLF